MARFTVYQCERCGHEHRELVEPGPNIAPMWSVCVTVKRVNKTCNDAVIGKHEQMWCEKCCYKFKLFNFDPTPHLEDAVSVLTGVTVRSGDVMEVKSGTKI